MKWQPILTKKAIRWMADSFHSLSYNILASLRTHLMAGLFFDVERN
jgi:hypothetical protein